MLWFCHHSETLSPVISNVTSTYLKQYDNLHVENVCFSILINYLNDQQNNGLQTSVSHNFLRQLFRGSIKYIEANCYILVILYKNLFAKYFIKKLKFIMMTFNYLFSSYLIYSKVTQIIILLPCFGSKIRF